MLKNYRGLHAEKRRLEAGVDELQLARQRLTKVCQAARSEFISFLLSFVVFVRLAPTLRFCDFAAVGCRKYV